MFDVSCLTVPTNISNLFIKANEKHNHKTRFSSSCNFYINPFAPGDFAEKRVLKLVKWFSGHCCAIKS